MSNIVKVINITREKITFENGIELYSEHEDDCCEEHYLDFTNLTLDDFDGLEFDVSTDDFFGKIEDYGIELKPVHGFSVKIPGYGINNGCYSADLALILTDNKSFTKTFDIIQCQAACYVDATYYK